MNRPATPRWDRELALVAGVATCISVISFLSCFRQGTILLYGDAVAHINIARRVFDSRTPGLLQLGTVWLPLPHLLMIPFLLSGWAWRTGLGGSIPSLIAYVAGVVGLFRLVRGALSGHAHPEAGARLAAWFAALVYGLNPNLLYLQATAMTETLYLALFIWAVVFFSEFAQQISRADEETRHAATRSLTKCGICLAGAALTRYDGWFASAAMAALGWLMTRRLRSGREALRGSVRNFVLLAATAPVFWLAYNGIIYRNPLEFANGPYSARALEQKAAKLGLPPHPGSHNMRIAATYFLKSAELNLAEGNWQKAWVVMLLAGSLVVLVFGRGLSPLLLLWVPLPFYMLSIAYGGVPIFLPVWWPFSSYNVRYGLQLLPAVAVFAGLVMYFLIAMIRNMAGRSLVVVAMSSLVAVSYISVWRAQPVCFREAWVNSRSRIALEGELAGRLKTLPPDSTLLMYLGDHVGALQQAGIPLRRVISEGNHRTWKQPSDPEGLWERALADPAGYADYVVAIEGDPVWVATRDRGFQPLAEIEVPAQPRATIYRAHPLPR